MSLTILPKTPTYWFAHPARCENGIRTLKEVPKSPTFGRSWPQIIHSAASFSLNGAISTSLHVLHCLLAYILSPSRVAESCCPYCLQMRSRKKVRGCLPLRLLSSDRLREILCDDPLEKCAETTGLSTQKKFCPCAPHGNCAKHETSLSKRCSFVVFSAAVKPFSLKPA